MLKTGENTYITLEEADVLLSGRPEEESWQALEQARREGCLMTAARRVEALPFRGRRHSIFQSLSFPRDGSRRVPAAVKQAQALEAAALAAEPQSGQASPPKRGAAPFGSPQKGLSSREAAALLQPYLLSGNAL